MQVTKLNNLCVEVNKQNNLYVQVTKLNNLYVQVTKLNNLYVQVTKLNNLYVQATKLKTQYYLRAPGEYGVVLKRAGYWILRLSPLECRDLHSLGWAELCRDLNKEFDL